MKCAYYRQMAPLKVDGPEHLAAAIHIRYAQCGHKYSFKCIINYIDRFLQASFR